MHVRADLPPGTDDVALSAYLAEEGIAAAPLSRFYIGEDKRPGFLLGYTAVTTHSTEEAASRLCTLLREKTKGGVGRKPYSARNQSNIL